MPLVITMTISALVLHTRVCIISNRNVQHKLDHVTRRVVTSNKVAFTHATANKSRNVNAGVLVHIWPTIISCCFSNNAFDI